MEPTGPEETQCRELAEKLEIPLFTTETSGGEYFQVGYANTPGKEFNGQIISAPYKDREPKEVREAAFKRMRESLEKEFA